jgi:hypothetical protein
MSILQSKIFLKKNNILFYSPFIVTNDILEQIPLILDPITYLNVGKSSYRVDEIKQCMSKTFNSIYSILFNYNMSINSQEKTTNMLHSLFENKMINSSYKYQK